MKTDKLYLVGFMGAGKTSVADALGRRLGWEAKDIDALIEERERRPIADIFADLGEPHFRSAEREVLHRLLPLRNVVVATGGGTYAEPDNRALINADGVAIWLDVPFDVVLRRLPSDGRRPLSRDRADFEALYRQRRVAYRQAHVRMDAAGPLDELVERILDWLGY